MRTQPTTKETRHPILHLPCKDVEPSSTPSFLTLQATGKPWTERRPAKSHPQILVPRVHTITIRQSRRHPLVVHGWPCPSIINQSFHWAATVSYLIGSSGDARVHGSRASSCLVALLVGKVRWQLLTGSTEDDKDDNDGDDATKSSESACTAVKVHTVCINALWTGTAK